MKILAGIFITGYDRKQLNFSYNQSSSQSISHSTTFHQAPAMCLASEIAKSKIFKQEELFSCLLLCPCPLHDVKHLKDFQGPLGL